MSMERHICVVSRVRQEADGAVTELEWGGDESKPDDVACPLLSCKCG